MKTREIHRKIKQAIAEIEKDSPFVCLNVEAIAKKAGTDTRTAKRHLDILEENGLGKYCDAKRKTFSSTKKFSELVESKGK